MVSTKPLLSSFPLLKIWHTPTVIEHILDLSPSGLAGTCVCTLCALTRKLRSLWWAAALLGVEFVVWPFVFKRANIQFVICINYIRKLVKKRHKRLCTWRNSVFQPLNDPPVLILTVRNFLLPVTVTDLSCFHLSWFWLWFQLIATRFG